MTRTHDEAEFGFQIAPMLDVLFVLLLFFMVMAGMQKVETNIKVPLPGREGSPLPNVPVVLEISGNGQVIFNGVATDTASSSLLPETMARLTAALADAPERPVIIQPADDARHQRVMDVLDLCKAASVKNVQFSRVTD